MPRRFLLLLCASLAPALTQDAPSSAESLLRKAIEADRAQAARNWKFTFREDEEKISFDKHGKPQSPTHRTFENIMLEGDPYRKLVLIEGRPPDPKLQKRIDAEMEKERARRKAHPEIGRHEVRMGGVEQIARMCDSTVAGQELVSGRTAWRIEAIPKPDYHAANEEEKRLLGLKRIVWIDQQEGVAIKYLDIYLRPTAGFQPGSEFEIDYGKHGDAWLPDRLVLRYNIHMTGVLRGRGEDRKTFSEYQRFDVASKIVG